MADVVALRIPTSTAEEIGRLQRELQDTRDALQRATDAANLNAEQYATQRKAHREESDRYYAESGHLNKMAGELRDERNELQVENAKLKGQIVPANLASRVYAWIAANEDEILCDELHESLAVLRSTHRWAYFGFALHTIFWRIVNGYAIGRVGQQSNDGDFSMPKALTDELSAWRAAVSR